MKNKTHTANKNIKSPFKILMSGGGSGGHVFPAIAIAEALKIKMPQAEFLFIGAENKIEMDVVPKAGFDIKALPIIGLYRNLSFKTIQFPFKLIISLIKAWFMVSKFKPNIAIGTAGYASGVALKIAQWKGIPTYLQEQNAYPGITNRLLGKKAKKIFVAYDTLDQYFEKEKIIKTGNPMRSTVRIDQISRTEAFKYYGLSPNKKTIFLTGGSLGAKTLNQAMEASLEKFEKEDIQLLWQCGKIYEDEYRVYHSDHVKVKAFIDRMDFAYAIADLIISRAGGTISELAIVAKPTILVPSPNVAEDHQTKNVKALVEKNASILVKDSQAIEDLADQAIDLFYNEKKRKELAKNIHQFAKPDAAQEIANHILSSLK